MLKMEKKHSSSLTVALTEANKSLFGTKKRRLGAMEYARVTELVLGRMAVCTPESGSKACAMARVLTLTHKAMSTRAIGRTIRCTEAAR